MGTLQHFIHRLKYPPPPPPPGSLVRTTLKDAITHAGKGFCCLLTRILSIHSNDVLIFYRDLGRIKINFIMITSMTFICLTL